MGAGVRFWRELQPALILWVILLVVIGIGGIAINKLDADILYADVLMTVVMAAVVVGYCTQDGAAIRRVLTTPPPDLGMALTITLVVLLGLGLFMWSYLWMLGELLNLKSENTTDSFREQDWPVWSAVILISICPAVIEELAFRGVIFARLQRVMKPAEAMVVQAAMFSILHLAPLSLISHFVMGLSLGWLLLKTRSLYAGMLAHAMWNGLIVCLEYHNTG